MARSRAGAGGRGRGRGGAVATDDTFLAVTAGVCSAIVIPIAGTFMLVLGACATDWALACAALAHMTGYWATRGWHPPEQRVFLRRQVRQAELILRRFA